MEIDWEEKLSNRTETEEDNKQSINLLLCFSNIDTGKGLSLLAASLFLPKSDSSSITFLQLLGCDKSLEQAKKENFNWSRFLSESNAKKSEKCEITIRSFVIKSDPSPSDILKTAKEQNSNLLLMGVENSEIDLKLYQEYWRLKSNPANSENQIAKQFGRQEAHLLQSLSTVSEISPIANGIFINRELKKVEKIFIPILSHSDLSVLSLFNFRFAQKEGIKLIVWDAIGAIESLPKVQKLYQSYTKRGEESYDLWDNNKKIDKDFIGEQDLFIIGAAGWSRLANTNLPWIERLPSTLIIKEKTAKSI